ncbi:MAG: excinuclease ABC subunit UvrA [Verrucomicrobiales bacterium]|nr:excinuclease ABC subunit UvrA [Verrucomicrobiales bacterium]
MPVKKKKNRSDNSPSPAASIAVRGASQNNLKGIDLDIPLGKLNVVTGPSGSGKSSLAFQTLYAEGQRRYVETFSPYTRQFFDRMDKPAVTSIRGIPPAIAIEQSNNIRTTRSTVGTITEINDYLKLLFPRLATGYDPESGDPVRPATPQSVADHITTHFPDQNLLVTFPIPVPAKTKPAEFFTFLQSQGYLRIHIFAKTYRTDTPDSYTRKTLPAQVAVIQDRLKPTKRNNARLLEALKAAFKLGKGQLTLYPESAEPKLFNTSWHPLKAPTPGLFSFNNPQGACPTCRGFGKTIGVDIQRAIPDRTLTLRDGAIKAFSGDTYADSQADLERAAYHNGLDLDCPFDDLPDEDQRWVFDGDVKTGTEWEEGQWYGIRGFFKWQESRAYKMHVRVYLSRYRSYTTCPECNGTRLQPEALYFKIADKTLPDLWKLPVSDLLIFFETLPEPNDPTTRLVQSEITNRLNYLNEVGLSYLNLDRESRTLSGGEIQRVNLTTCLGASLTNTLFVLDEPSIGLHPRDTSRLVGVMETLRDKGNTLLVVEHEEAVIRAADHLIDIGPGRGELGGHLVFEGKLPKNSSAKTPSSLTLQYLSGATSIPIPTKRRKPKRTQKITVQHATQHNLKKINVDIPLGLFTCVSGVSGSGKSTLVHSVLYENIVRKRGARTEDEPGRCKDITGFERVGDVILVDQSPLARTPRSTPAVFVGAFDHIRKIFATSEAAVSAAFAPGDFSFNSGNGRCGRCSGTGYEKVEMQFLSDLFVVCPECDGRRYQKPTLEVKINGLSIADILDLTVTQAVTFFSEIPGKPAEKTCASLRPLAEVGLGYLRLGQPLNTLSGGESQRLKLVSHLPASSTKGKGLRTNDPSASLLIFDEPTTGLHFDDIRLLLEVFQRLVDSGNTVLVIEHNLDVINCADHLIELGPEGGHTGGYLVATGTPEQVAATPDSPTGRFLAPLLGISEAPLQKVADQATKYQTKDKRLKTRDKRNAISIHGAREHNLKDINIDIPRDEFVVVTGLSGSGKSTLAFDIVFAEGQRRFLDSMSPYARQFVTQMEKPDVASITGLPPTVAIEQRVSQGGGKSTVATITEVWQFLRLLWSKTGTQHCPESGLPVISQSVSAITSQVAAEAKRGSATVLAPVVKGRKGYHTDVAKWAAKKGYSQLLVDRQFKDTEGFERLERFREHDIDVVVAKLDKKTKPADARTAVDTALTLGKGTIRLITNDKKFAVLSTRMASPATGRSFDDLDPRMFSYNSPHGWCRECRGYGVIRQKARQRVLDLDRHDSVLAAELDEEARMANVDEDLLFTCPTCDGARLNRDARNVLVEGYRIEELAALSVADAAKTIAGLKFTGREKLIARDILPEIAQRLHFMKEVGLGYLQLDRSAKTLSGGEAQRIRLAAQLGSNLRGVLYVLDEPTIGLHPRDNVALLDTLTALRKKGNSLLVVEHDEETINRASHLIDLGPGAGRLGGELTFAGPPEELKNSGSPTALALTQPLQHPASGKRRKLPARNAKTGWIRIKGATANNLDNLDVQIPLGRLTVITGISGSGKSTLMRGVLFPAIKAMLNAKRGAKPKIENLKSLTGHDEIRAAYEVDQSPIGKTSRSCPATYVKVFDEIRKLFSVTPTARVRGYEPSRFSFNTKGGRCETCKGNGAIKLEMTFLPTTWIPCEDCNGLRYNSATLEIDYNGKHIGDVMNMSIAEAAEFFAANPKIHRTLQLLVDTGTGYLQLGQPSPTLSGGEAQRIKLVTELTRGQGRAQHAKLRKADLTFKNLYVIEEPTIGLHMADVKKLVDVLHRLVDEGHTVVVVEHNLDVMAEADYILDIGPEAGTRGGKLVTSGPPEKVAAHKTSRTAPFLKQIL